MTLLAASRQATCERDETRQRGLIASDILPRVTLRKLSEAEKEVAANE